MKTKTIIAKSFDQHLQEEFKKSPEFEKAYEEEVARVQIGWKVVQLMRHLSQAQLDKRIKTSQQTISRLEDY